VRTIKERACSTDGDVGAATRRVHEPVEEAVDAIVGQ
jgi:hypothetical protein